MSRVTPSAIMELIKTTAARDYISFASGLPDPALYPVELLRELTNEVLATDGRAALQYGPAEGYPPLRELVAALLCDRGLAATSDSILITNGSQQALDLAARAILDPGDRVALERPSYLAAIQAFDSYGARYSPVPMDDEGVEYLGLLAAAQAGPKLIYTLPNFQNPTGITMSAARRKQVAEIAAARDIFLLEDDAYYDLRYEGRSLPPVCALAPNEGAIYTGTFSKSIAPGVRVGYLHAHPHLVARLGQLKQIADLHTGSLTQRVVYQYCARGHLKPGIERFCESYRARRDVLLEALERELSGLVTWARPAGGMFVWATLPDARHASRLLERAMARGVVFVPGASFHADGGGENTFRLNFVSATEDRIREGIGILGEVLREWLAE